MTPNAGRNLPAQRARRRPVNHRGAAVAALDDDAYRFVFDDFDHVPVVVFKDELWTICDVRFLRVFNTPFPDRLAAVVADGRVCVAGRPWFPTDDAGGSELGCYTGVIAHRRWNGALLVETRLPRYRSPLAERFPYVLNWLERIALATVGGRVS
jgi:hypothetical protein